MADKSILDLLTRISNRINLIIDYPVEVKRVVKGNTTWVYRKYKSGIVKMIGKRDGNFSVSEWKASGYNYYADIAGVDLPFTLKELWESKITLYNDGCYIAAPMQPAGSNTVYGLPSVSYTGGFSMLRCSKPPSTLTYHITYTVTGLWKSFGGGTA